VIRSHVENLVGWLAIWEPGRAAVARLQGPCAVTLPATPRRVIPVRREPRRRAGEGDPAFPPLSAVISPLDRDRR
jgi:hypothetical protein